LLVPRYISVLGLRERPFIFACGMQVMFGVFLQLSVWWAILAIPVTAYEMTLSVWLIVKGFNSSVVDTSDNLR
jgi:uncharacterized membrane protein